MAIFIPNKTTCTLCGEKVKSEAEAVLFPAFIPPGHTLSKYSDSVFHRSCFESWDRHGELSRLYERYRQIWDSRPRNLTSLEEIEDWGKNAFSTLFVSQVNIEDAVD